MTPNYWTMSKPDLVKAWREHTAQEQPYDTPDEFFETLNFLEDAILQRIGAPDDAGGDDPTWQARIREFSR